MVTVRLLKKGYKKKKSGGSVSFTFVAVEGGTNELLLENDLPSRAKLRWR